MEHDMTCGHCGRTWNSTETPTPAARCPFEAEHEYPSEEMVTLTLKRSDLDLLFELADRGAEDLDEQAFGKYSDYEDNEKPEIRAKLDRFNELNRGGI